MKKIAFAALFSLLSLTALAQYEPTTTWPYLYDDFTSGELVTPVGEHKKADFNVHLLHSTLHFISGDMIKEVGNGDVFSVQIGKDYFVCAGGRLMKVVAKNDNGIVAQGYDVDLATLNSTGGAYGSSSTTVGTMALSSLEGIGGTSSNMNHMDLKSNKDNGKTLPIIKKYYIVTNGQVTYATRKDVTEIIGADAMKAFTKANKVKWNDPQSLLAVVDLLSKQ